MAIQDTRKVRMPAVAGQFYNGNALALRREISTCEAALPEKSRSTLPASGVILPHAGYVFSMPTALRTLREAVGGSFKRAVILSPSHRVAFRGMALSEDGLLRTPFGDSMAECELASELAAEHPELFVIREEAHRQEHAVEVQLPLLQYYFKELPVLPIVCGEMPLPMIRQAAEVFSGRFGAETLWVISSDFTHYGRNFRYVPFTENIRENLYKLDGEAAELIARRDFDGFVDFLRRTGATICGMFPILLYLAILQAQGTAAKGEIVEYTNCADKTKEWSHCVGYAGIAFR
ncbi:MAG: AmmeMemoRadiSam system protein B [Lentisphaeria bacterium]|nr:AmmeMemoRadiSam system protein B [Lentisphaeria bacterium]